jgi:hypothetical protein
MLSRPLMVNETSVHTIERASFALLDYLGRLLAGKPQSPVGLFPQYAAVQAWPALTVCTRRTCGKPTSPGTTCRSRLV